jgi:outer membrane protein assembly factor BamB
MTARLISIEGSQVKIEVTIDLSRSMLDTEETIQRSLNEGGCIATQEVLKYLDTDGSALEIGDQVWRTKGAQPKAYQTPYGEVVIHRHVYQRSGGGKTYCPMERDARIVVTSTPLFARQVSSKAAYGAARDVQRDLQKNHGRSVSVSYLQRLSEAVGTVVQAKEESWNYEIPTLNARITTVGV